MRHEMIYQRSASQRNAPPRPAPPRHSKPGRAGAHIHHRARSRTKGDGWWSSKQNGRKGPFCAIKRCKEFRHSEPYM